MTTPPLPTPTNPMLSTTPPFPTTSNTMLPTTPTTTSYLMVQGSSPTLSGTTKQQVQNLDQSWSQVVSNEEVLEKSLQTIQASRAKFMAPSGYGIYKTTDVDRQSLKMQKQEDIQSQIDYDNNLLILTGAALALCVLMSFQLYLD